MAEKIEDQPPLLQLPTEILQQIAEFADRRSLKALRLTCRDVAAIILDIYAKALFTDVAFFMQCPEDLNLALKVVEHPAFGPVIRKIRWMVEEVREPDVFLVELMPGGDEKNEAVEQLERQEVSWREQKEMRTKRDDHRQLTAVLSKLKELGKLQEVAICDTLATGPKPVNLLEEKDDTSGTELDSPAPDQVWPFERVADALQAADLRVSSFKVCVEEWCMPVHLIGDDQALLDKAQFILRSLETLELRLWTEQEAGPVKTFIKLLSAASRLKHLDLQVFDSDTLKPYDINAFTFPDLLFNEDFKRLETLILAGFYLQAEKFLTFVRRHKSMSLKRLDLNTLSIMGLEWYWKSGDSLECTLRRLLDLPGKYEHLDSELW